MARLITTYEEWFYCMGCDRITLIEELTSEDMLCYDCVEEKDNEV